MAKENTVITYEDLKAYYASYRSGQGGKKRWFIIKPTDLWARLYVVTIDMMTQAPKGLIERCYRMDPRVPDLPDQFLTVPEGEHWHIIPRFVDYIRQLKYETRLWKARLDEEMTRIFDAKAAEMEPHPKALRIVGPPPQSWELVALQARGDRFAIGYQQTPTPAAEAILRERGELLSKIPTTVRMEDDDELRLPGELERMAPGLREAERYLSPGEEHRRRVNAFRLRAEQEAREQDAELIDVEVLPPTGAQVEDERAAAQERLKRELDAIENEDEDDSILRPGATA